jgi:hypothetical protein
VRASNDSTRARLPLCSGLATSRCTSTRVPAGSGCGVPAAAMVGALALRMSARTTFKVCAVCSVVRWAGPSTRWRCKRGLQHVLGLGIFALAREGYGQNAHTEQRVRMLGPVHALQHHVHLALDPLSVGVFALVVEG